MELKEKTNETIRFTSKMNISLANAIRRSVNEVLTLAIDECDVYKNDSALYDEIIAHRLGLIPLKNQKIKANEKIEIKLTAKGKEGGYEVMSSELGEISIYPTIPIVFLDKNQEIEIVARIKAGKAIEHTKYAPGILFYRHLPKIKISKEGESQIELSQIYPEVFSFNNKLAVKDASLCEIDNEDTKIYPGIDISFDDTLVFQIESWGQMTPKEIFIDSCKVLKENLNELLKTIK